MTKTQITNINKQILIEKSNFISRNSTFFYKNLLNIEILNSLKNILLDSAPLLQCPDYEELVNKIKKSKIRNINELNYGHSFEVLFAIVNLIRNNPNAKLSQIETLRQYVRYISTQTSGKMYYSMQKTIIIDKEKVDSIIENDEQYTKERRNR